MSALRFAIDKVGGVTECARVCNITPRGVYKWIHRDALPRTEFTGETRYAKAMAEASSGAFTAEWLLANAGPRSVPKITPQPGMATTA
ncbi:hypothetical protein [Halomonas nitroreducens]|uniref:Helix-turn-helix domain-containing protein n=1 Tax=Halomonas nitroreducens TaxID=447425 RepID=A0A3S0JVD7_9GAMM|nr:hypothetical protein [Halomonas nitroreducens]RTR01967.1 hypothetical protein EKG36_13240 [Halomonas nitroreducens]